LCDQDCFEEFFFCEEFADCVDSFFP
jgi:hypothetical protein